MVVRKGFKIGSRGSFCIRPTTFNARFVNVRVALNPDWRTRQYLPTYCTPYPAVAILATEALTITRCHQARMRHPYFNRGIRQQGTDVVGQKSMVYCASNAPP